MTTTTTVPTTQQRTPSRERAPRLCLSGERIHFASNPWAGRRTISRLGLTGGFVGR